MNYSHKSVLLHKSIDFLNIKKGGTYLDVTLGGGGHLGEIYKRLKEDATLIGVDQDIDAINNAKKKHKEFNHLIHSNFRYIDKVLSDINIDKVDGVIADLGFSLHQIKASNRGFSFMQDERLDMRMDLRSDKTAFDVVNYEEESVLRDIFLKYGEERYSKKIAYAIVKARETKKIESTLELVNIIKKNSFFKPGKNPATKIFQALRIFVNDELENLKVFLDKIFSHINKGGRICIISFHSLEDRIVKKRMKFLEKQCVCPKDFPVCVCNKQGTIKIINKKIVTPDELEIEANPMARSARLRVAEII